MNSNDKGDVINHSAEDNKIINKKNINTIFLKHN